MTSDVIGHLKRHYASVAEELRARAQQAGLLDNPTGVGTEREEVYRGFLERHLPKVCDVFLGGYLFDRKGKSSAQIDVIVTTGNTPRFRMPSGNRHIAPLEGSIAAAEIKSRLNKESLENALENCASIPAMPDQAGIVPPYLRAPEDRWQDSPYKIVFAYDGINADTVSNHIAEYYSRNATIPSTRRPNIIHVLGKYMIMRTTPVMTVIDRDGKPDRNQPELGEYKTFTTGPDISAMGWIANDLQTRAFLGNHLLFKCDDLLNSIMERVQREWTG